jgi:hypothetical protein
LKALFTIVLFGVLYTSAIAQNDSSKIVFGYGDSTKITVEILADNPDLEPKTIVVLGIGSIGNLETSSAAASLELRHVLNQHISIDARWTSSLQDLETDLVSNVDLITHLTLFKFQSKTPMGLKLLDVKKGEDKRSYKQPYYAQYPFKTRHDLRLDAGISVIANNSRIKFNTIEAKESFYSGKNFNYTNVLIGINYARVRAIKLEINGLKEKSYYGKLNAGINFNYNLSHSGIYSICAFDSICVSSEFNEVASLEVNKAGIGFDIGYSFLTSRPKFVMSFDVHGRFVPSFKGYAHFYEDQVYRAIPNYKFSKPLLVMPQISVGYIIGD